MLTNRKRYLKELTNEQCRFVQKHISERSKANLIKKFHERFKCWISLNHILAVADETLYSLGSIDEKVDAFLKKYYGKVTTSILVDYLDKYYHLGLSCKEISEYAVNYLNLKKSAAKAREYLILVNMNTKEKVAEGAVNDLAEYLGVRKKYFNSVCSSYDYIRQDNTIYKIVKVELI